MIDIHSKIKPLYANLLRLGIGKYLISDNFKILCVEKDIDGWWEVCKESVPSHGRVAVDNERVFGIFLTEVFSTGKERFIGILGEILVDFAKWSKESKDFSEIKRDLLDLGYSLDEIDWIFSQIEVVSPARHPTSSELEVKEEEIDEEKPIEILKRIFSQFHSIVRQLRKRYNNRPTLDVSDEYDVQDLLCALLRLYFDDIRKEEGTPSYAGKAARMDILLKEEKIVIEVKIARKGLGEKEIGDQLLVDIERYKEHKDCRNLVCFIYDPEESIANPKGLINDLSNQSRENLKVIPFINP